jgi:phosphoglycolate phosphatase-like HAD superfamily hydrolase
VPAAPRPTLVLDFDGTLCLGDDPIHLFADELAALVDEDGAARVRTQLAAFLAGEQRIEGAEDGYHALFHLGRPFALPDEAVAAAYYRSRDRMAAGEGTVHAPDGIVELLDDVRDAGVRTVLVTNAPVTGATSWLETVGVAQRLDAVIPDAGKPGRMAEHLRSLLAGAGAEEAPHYLMSVGDVWVNDVEPALAIGALGLYIDRYTSGRGPSSASGATIGELYPTIRAWAANPAAFLECLPD